MPVKTYLLKGKAVPYKVSKCPKCGANWNVKMYYFDNDPNNISSETYNFAESTTTENKIYTKTIKCFKCDFKVETKYEILDEKKVLEAITKNDEVLLRDKTVTTPKFISRTVSGDKLTDKNLKDMIKSFEDMI